MATATKQTGAEVVQVYNPRTKITLNDVIAARNNFIVDENMTELISIIFPNDFNISVFDQTGAIDEVASGVLMNMAKGPLGLWYVALQIWDDITTYGCAILNRYYERIDGVEVLRLRRLPPESFTKLASGIKGGVAGIMLPGIILKSTGYTFCQTYFDDNGKEITEVLDPSSIVLMTDPKYAGKVGGESRLKKIVPLLQNLNLGYSNFAKAVGRASVPSFYMRPIPGQNVMIKAGDETLLDNMIRNQDNFNSFRLPVGFEINPMPFTPNDMASSFTTYIEQQIRDFFNPMNWLSDVGIFGSSESQYNLIMTSVSGQRRMIEDVLETVLKECLDLNGWEGYSVSLEFTQVLIENVADNVSKVSVAFSSRIATVNEMRKMLSLPELDEEGLTALTEQYAALQPAAAGGLGALGFSFKDDPRHTIPIISKPTIDVINADDPRMNDAEADMIKRYDALYNDAEDAIIKAVKGGADADDPKINEAMRGLSEKQLTAMARDAAYGYAIGTYNGYKSLGLTYDQTAAPARVMNFYEQYAKMAIEQGVTIIQGKPNDWVSRFTQSERDSIYSIIRDGLKEGKYPGTKARADGTYAKDTIGYDLQNYFNDRKSHATMVARTETGRSMNYGRLDTYGSYGVTEVRVMDGGTPTSDPYCTHIDGSVWPIDYAMSHELQHPNCIRSFAPIKPKGGYIVSSNNQVFNYMSTITKYVMIEA